jgi:DNA-nicking Smr family endonuclease
MTMADDDERAFRDAMRNVRPLKRRAARPPTPAPGAVARFARAETAAVLRDSLAPPQDASMLESSDELLFVRPGTPGDVVRKLRRGQWAVQAEIDLHGLGRQAAHDALRDFIAESVTRQLRCVRVIHGKGRRSGTRGPVIKRVVDHWLRRIEAVVAFVSARPVDGGTGAVYVLLAPRRIGRR